MTINRRIFIAVGLVLAMALPAAGQTKMNEDGYRRGVINGPKPQYPAALVARGITGVAVASILVDGTGKVQTVVVLEAPDPLVADAVRTAVQQWTFVPVKRMDGMSAGRPIAVASKLTFYFQVRNGVGAVLNPSEMPGARLAPPGVTRGTRSGPPPAPPAVHVGGHDISRFEINKAEFDKRVAAGAVVVDARERDAFRRSHHPRAINIPHDEITVRAPVEIPTDKDVAVDCSQTDDFTCMVAVVELEEVGFKLGAYKQ